MLKISISCLLTVWATQANARVDIMPGLPGGRPLEIKPQHQIQLIGMHAIEAALKPALAAGAAIIDVEAARCDTPGNDCDIQSMSGIGKHIAFEVKKGKGIVFVASSGRKYPVSNKSARDEQLMLDLGRALERVSDRCKSVVIVSMIYGQLSTPMARIEAIALQPGCVL